MAAIFKCKTFILIAATKRVGLIQALEPKGRFVDWKQRTFNALSVAGSVASITGITALWLTQLKPSLNWLLVLPIAVVAVSIFLAISAMVVLIARIGYERISSPPHTPYGKTLKFAYASFAVGAGTMLLTLFAILLSGAAVHQAKQALGL